MRIANDDEIPMFIDIDRDEDEIFFKEVDFFNPFFHFFIDFIMILNTFIAFVPDFEHFRHEVSVEEMAPFSHFF